MPQRYTNMLLVDTDGFFEDYVLMPIMFDEGDESAYKTVKWSKISSSSEVID